MRHIKLIWSLVAATVALGCGGATRSAADPKTGAENSGSNRDSAESDGSHAVDPSDSSEASDAAPKSAKQTASSSDRSSGVPSHKSSEVDADKKTDADDDDANSGNTAPAADRHPAAEGAAHAGATVDDQAFGDCLKSNSGLVLTVDRKTVSLEEGRLQAKMDGPICSLVMRIMRKDGQPTIEKSFRYTDLQPELRWDPVPRDQIEKIELRITAKDHAYQAVMLIPWSVAIDHKEVQFDTNKAVIRDSEVPKLTDSLAKIREVLAKVEGKDLGTVTLFIAGHTDTQGSDEHNMTLSRNRAQAIAAWFVKQGLCVPIAFEGFGETALKKLTADNVDEQANRRVDYILAVEPPVIKKGANPAWKWISKGC